MNQDELTPQERRAFAELPREDNPSAALEDVTVAALRRRGLLRDHRSHALTLSPLRLALAASLVCALLLGAFSLGQYQGSRQTADALIALQQSNDEQVAAEVQRTAAAYLTALADLADLAEGTRNQASPQQEAGREAAMQALYQVADRMVALAPDDPVASRILQAFQQADAQVQPVNIRPAEQRVIWF